MASSGKTEALGLSLWEAADRPERMDFRQDNEQLEALVGPHLADAALHLSAAEKQFVSKPMDIAFYTGTGKASRTIPYSAGVAEPRFMLVYDKNGPPQCVLDGTLCLYAAWGTSKYGSTPGLRMDSKAFHVFQQQDETETEGYRYCLNQLGKTYVTIVIP